MLCTFVVHARLFLVLGSSQPTSYSPGVMPVAPEEALALWGCKHCGEDSRRIAAARQRAAAVLDKGFRVPSARGERSLAYGPV